jgi:predicted DNA-binding transcriptional regulator YafY
MVSTSARLLRLLTVLQSRGFWAGESLAERLDVTPRTVRRDIDRLRGLGYVISASSGPGGGYRLSQGRDLPPLLLDDEEAVAVAAALRIAVDAFKDLGETALSALVKLEQLMPARLRHRLGVLHAVTVSLDDRTPPLRPALLTTIAGACRDRELLTFRYRDRAGRVTRRTVEPMQLAHVSGRVWYLVAWDRSRQDWRTLRADRIQGRIQVRGRFVPRALPAEATRIVSDAISFAAYPFRARFRLKGSAETLAARLPAWLGVLEPVDARHCILSVGADTPTALAVHALLADTEFTLVEPESLRPVLDTLAWRLARSTRPSMPARRDGG